MPFNIKAPIILIKDRFFKKYPKTSKIPSNSGKTVMRGNKKVAVYKNKSGEEFLLSPYCTHLGCVIDWNKEKKEWHCPCHGSIFSKTGEVKQGPAKKPLKKLDDENKEYTIKITGIRSLANNVKEFTTEKPKKYTFKPGQATNIVILNKKGEKIFRPFTFTSTNKQPFLKFIIKQYPSHNGVTKKLHKMKVGDKLLITEPFGAIQYKGEGLFLAAGTGINPFLAILRDLQEKDLKHNNIVILSNKTKKDIYLEKEMSEILKKGNFISTLTEEKLPEYKNGRIDKKIIKEKLGKQKKYVYICGPEGFEKAMKKILSELEVKEDMIISEQW